MRRAVLLLALLAPTATAEPSLFEVALEDARGDVRGWDERALDRPDADILNFSSVVTNEFLRMYVRMAAPPIAPDDSIELRVWYKDSKNGSFDALDIAVHGAPEPKDRFEAIARRDRFENDSPIDARYHVNGRTWIFALNASLLAEADCFDVEIHSDSSPKPRVGPQGFDHLDRAEGGCIRGQEPEWMFPDPILPSFSFHEPAPMAEAPGTRVPTPAPGLWLVVGASCLVAAACRRRAP